MLCNALNPLWRYRDICLRWGLNNKMQTSPNVSLVPLRATVHQLVKVLLLSKAIKRKIKQLNSPLLAHLLMLKEIIKWTFILNNSSGEMLWCVWWLPKGNRKWGPPVYDVPAGRWCFLDEFYLKHDILYLVVGCCLREQLMLHCVKQTVAHTIHLFHLSSQLMYCSPVCLAQG